MSERRYGGNTIAQELRETHASTNYQREVSTHAAQWIEELEREVATLRADRERLEKIEAVARQLVKDNHDGYDALGGADFDELRAALGIARWGDAAREAGDE